MNEQIKKDIIKCSRCGLCMDVCPVYKAKKTETSVLRGKFLQILGLIRGDLKYDRRISYNLDLCLSCGKCKKACPSEIDAIRIFSEIRGEKQNFLEKLFYSAPFFKLKMLAIKILYKIKYPTGRKNKNYFQKDERTAYFKGCATRAMGYGFNTREEKFSCCGLPFFIKGRLDLYEKYKNRNLKIIEKFDKVVFDCATCFDTVSKYEGVNKEKIIYFTDFYKSLNLKYPKKIKAVFHKPCHLSDEKYSEIKEIISNIENVEFVNMGEYNECCGFGGDFFIRHLKTAHFLSLKKAENIINSGADVVLTTCPTCLWSLKYGIKYKKTSIKAYDLADFINECRNTK